ncbi:MAG: hypothetical protein U1E42_09325 [Rhodospirillales bacterium]
MSRFVSPAAPDTPCGAGVLPVYLGLYLVLLAFFVYFVAVSAAQRQTEAAIADDKAAAAVAPPIVVVAELPAPPLAALADVFRSLALPGAAGERNGADRLEAAVAAERIFVADTAKLRPDFAPVLDRLAKDLTELGAPDTAAGTAVRGGDRVTGEDTLDLHLLVGLPAASEVAGEPASVADILAERLAVARAAALARALLARGVPPTAFAVGVAPAAGPAVRFVFHLGYRRAASPASSHD